MYKFQYCKFNESSMYYKNEEHINDNIEVIKSHNEHH